jgi:hypothetical protein
MPCAPGCSSAAELLARASAVLADDHQVVGRTWPQDELVGHLNEGLCALKALRPDEFADVVQMNLEPGAMQRLPPQYAAFIGLVSNTMSDEAGQTSEASAITESDLRFVAALRKKPCLGRDLCEEGAAPYAVISYTRDPIVETVFTVSPPVPVGSRPQVSVRVVLKPKRFTTATLGDCLGVDCDFEAPLLDWVLMRAYSKETESQYAIAQVDRYRKAWYDAFNASYLQDSRFTGGYWTGQDLKRPAADPNFRQH